MDVKGRFTGVLKTYTKDMKRQKVRPEISNKHARVLIRIMVCDVSQTKNLKNLITHKFISTENFQDAT